MSKDLENHKAKGKKLLISPPYVQQPIHISPPTPFRTPTPQPASPLHMMIPSPVEKTTYIGLPWQEIACLIYLLYKYPKDCVAIPDGVMSSYAKKITNYGLTLKTWERSSLLWMEKDNNFKAPRGLWVSVKKCLEKRSNFIIIPMTFICANEKDVHTNLLLYDSKTKELERFEPNGYLPGNCFNPVNLDEKLKTLFNSNVEEGMVVKSHDPLEFCPYSSFQVLQYFEYLQREGDPGGFCAAWSIWYADTRMANPNKSREQVVEMALTKLRSTPRTMTQFIRSYSAFLAKIKKLLEESKDPSAVFASLIQKYT